jgi:NAD(P)-dependent dehydrogenase (short-subunit alcohol dehydrogenase family)
VIGQFGDLDGLLAGQPVAGGQHRHPGLAEQRPQRQPALVDRQPHVAHVGPPVVHHVGLVVPAGAQQVDGEAGMSPADRPGPGWAAAAGVCGAMDALTRALAVELAPIRVNAVKAGVTRSPLWGDGAEVEEMYATIGRSLPLGRVGEVGDVASACLYLMTQPYATGTITTIDGGSVLV